MNLAGEMQACLVSLDVRRARELWRLVSPHLPPIESDAEMLTTLHMSRTQSELINKRLRFYSHRWLVERNYPSLLPDRLKPSAERIYPIRSRSVGISVNAKSPLFKPVVKQVGVAMQDAVMDVYADGREDDIPLIKNRMKEARNTVIHKLLGIKSDD